MSFVWKFLSISSAGIIGVLERFSWCRSSLALVQSLVFTARLLFRAFVCELARLFDREFDRFNFWLLRSDFRCDISEDPDWENSGSDRLTDRLNR